MDLRGPHTRTPCRDTCTCVLTALSSAALAARRPAARSAGWTTYVWVDSADETVALVEAQGGQVIAPPVDIPSAGRAAVCADPSGAVFGLWQAATPWRPAVNVPGPWNFSELHSGTREAQESTARCSAGCPLVEMGAGQKTACGG